MNYSGPYRHKLILAGEVNSRKIVSKLKDSKQVSFTIPLSLNKRLKIYVLKIKDEIVYVGYTSQSISTRLNAGLKASGKNGYHGYKWKNDSDEVELLVFVFEGELIGDKVKDSAIINFVEAIEAELVFKIRTETGKWPKYQNEIHFNNERRDFVLGVVECIYKNVIG